MSNTTPSTLTACDAGRGHAGHDARFCACGHAGHHLACCCDDCEVAEAHEAELNQAIYRAETEAEGAWLRAAELPTLEDMAVQAYENDRLGL